MLPHFTHEILGHAYFGMELRGKLAIIYELSMRGRRQNLKLGTLLPFPARAEGDAASEPRRAVSLHPPVAVTRVPIKPALSLVDGRIRAADAPSSKPGKAIGAAAAIDGLRQQSRETAQAATCDNVPAAQPNNREWLQSEHAEIVRTARRLAPLDELPATGRQTVSSQRKRRKLRLGLSAISAGILLVSLMAGDVLLHSFVPASSRETASSPARFIPTAEAHSAARAAAAEAAVDPGPAEANRALDLPTAQAVEKP
jgi:hypothetical protein